MHAHSHSWLKGNIGESGEEPLALHASLLRVAQRLSFWMLLDPRCKQEARGGAGTRLLDGTLVALS